MQGGSYQRISCIIPHHCGDHENCCYDDCRMVRLGRHCLAKFRVECPESKATNEEILLNHKKDILQAYVKVSRFNGKIIMSMGKKGQATCYQEITKRLDESNIGRVALAMSSNDCKNFFGMLVKYSHGKRIFLGQTDSWEVYQILVAGKKTDHRFADKVQNYHGIISSHVRDTNTEKLINKKRLDRERTKGDRYKQRRKVRQYAKLKDTVKNKLAPDSHRPNKLSPKDTCQSQDKVTGNAKKPTAKPSRVKVQ